MTDDTTIADLSFEDALKRLETIVHRLESGEATLDEAIDLYARRRPAARAQCEARLDAAQARIEAIRSGRTARRAAPRPSPPAERSR